MPGQRQTHDNLLQYDAQLVKLCNHEHEQSTHYSHTLQVKS